MIHQEDEEWFPEFVLGIDFTASVCHSADNRRKIRCDGLWPTCTQYLGGNRATDCKYTIGNQRLQAKARTPEDSQANTPSVTLHDTHSQTPKLIIDNPPSDLRYPIDTLVPYAFDLAREHNPPFAYRLDTLFSSRDWAIRSGSGHFGGTSRISFAPAENRGRGPQVYMQASHAECIYRSESCQHSDVVGYSRSLHIRSGGAPAAGSFDFLASFLPRLPLPGDAIEEQELYTLVKFAEVIYVGSPDVGSTVSTAVYWPDASKDGSCASHGANRNPISQFLPAQCFRTEGGTLLGLQTRASTLLGEAHSVTAAYYRDCKGRPTSSTAFPTPQRYLDHLVPEAHHSPLSLRVVPSNRVCVETTTVRAVQALNGMENPKIMNPICVMSWGVFFFTLQGELRRLRSRPWQGYDSASSDQGPNGVSEIDIVNAIGGLASWSGQYSFAIKFT
ncbi:hypothetical protein EDD15DRAFT_2521321 [Pisolithus albus]|nr:hypothetical protein EDD15DRAFT_2521321 [Pisolithus albus]